MEAHKFNHIRQEATMCPHGRAYWRNLANMIEPSVCCGDAALCEITLSTCFCLQNAWDSTGYQQGL